MEVVRINRIPHAKSSHFKFITHGRAENVQHFLPRLRSVRSRFQPDFGGVKCKLSSIWWRMSTINKSFTVSMLCQTGILLWFFRQHLHTHTQIWINLRSKGLPKNKATHDLNNFKNHTLKWGTSAFFIASLKPRYRDSCVQLSQVFFKRRHNSYGGHYTMLLWRPGQLKGSEWSADFGTLGIRYGTNQANCKKLDSSGGGLCYLKRNKKRCLTIWQKTRVCLRKNTNKCNMNNYLYIFF